MSDDKKANQRTPQAFAVPEPTSSKAPKGAARPKKAQTETAGRKPQAMVPPPELAFSDTDEAFFAAQERDELQEIALPSEERRNGRRIRWGTIAASALGFLLTASLGLWIQDLVTSLFAQNTWLGWVSLAAAAALALAVLIFIIREVTSVWRLKNTSGLRQDIEAALKNHNSKDINRLTAKLESHFEHQPKTAHGRAVLQENKNEVMDAVDRFAMTERELLAGLDAEAQAVVLNASKRVSVVTAVSPRAVFDIGYVLYENIRLIRVICELYGGRTGLFGTFSLLRKVIAHLAITGTISLGEGMVQQLLGHGLAAKLSARLGEGMINGVMTARIGLSAIDICRPAPFYKQQRPKLSSFIATLTKLGTDGSDKSTKNKAA